MEKELTVFYISFNREVGQPYSEQEQTIISRIIKLIASQLQQEKKASTKQKVKTPRAEKPVGKSEGDSPSAQTLEVERVFAPGYFKFVFPASDPFSVSSRRKCLCQVKKLLESFFGVCNSRITGVPYSHQERAIMSRIKRIWVHELRNTPKYDMFKRKTPSRKSPTAEEEQEIANQRKDEKRMKAVSIPLSKYNPLSQKYKDLKEKL